MKNLIIIILIAFAQLVIAQTKVSFYYPDQVSVLTTTQLDSIIKIAKSKKVVKVVGFANSIPNYTTKQSNEELALHRGLYLSAFLNVELTSTVVNSTSRLDQRVDIYFEDKPTLDIVKIEKVNKVEYKDTVVSNNSYVKVVNTNVDNTVNKIQKEIIYVDKIVYFCDCKNKSIDELKEYSYKMYSLYKDQYTDLNIKESALLCFRQTRRYLHQLEKDNDRKDRLLSQN